MAPANPNQIQLDTTMYGGETLYQQTQLSATSSSPTALSLKQPTVIGHRVTVVVRLPSGSVTSVTDDTGNIYSLVTKPVMPDGTVCEVWQATSITSCQTVTVSTTDPVASATLSEIHI